MGRMVPGTAGLHKRRRHRGRSCKEYSRGNFALPILILYTKAEIVDEIKRSFAGVTLDGGLTLNQTKVIDSYGEGTTAEGFSALPCSEVTNDWTAIPAVVLDEYECFAHTDQKGFKYYLPALTLRMLENYDSSSMMCISTIHSLNPKIQDKEYLYSELNDLQLRTVARFMEDFPNLVELWYEDKTIVERAFTRYWSRYL